MTAVETQTAGETPEKGTTQVGGIGTKLDCLAYLLWVEKWLRSNGENRLADDYREAVKDGEFISFAA